MIQRILFINSLQFDYLEDLLFGGLTELLGPDNVVSLPLNYHYYFSKYQYPKNIGQCRPPLRYLLDRLALKEKLRRFEFDAVVIGSTKEDAFKSYLMIEEKIPKGIPIMYIDGGDWPEIGGDAIREQYTSVFEEVIHRRAINLIFKREYLLDRQYEKNVFPLPFSFKPARHWTNGTVKKYDVVFWAVESDPLRKTILKLIQDKYDCKENGSVQGQTFRNYRRHGTFFLQELSSSKIAYNFKGAGWDTLRYWEIPGVASFMISGLPRIKIPNNFNDREHAVFCKDDASDLLSLTDYYLTHEREREEIAKNGSKHVQQFHTYTKRAQYFLDVSNEYLSKKFN